MTPAELRRRRDRVARMEARRPATGVIVTYSPRNENQIRAAADVVAEVLFELLDAKGESERG